MFLLGKEEMGLGSGDQLKPSLSVRPSSNLKPTNLKLLLVTQSKKHKIKHNQKIKGKKKQVEKIQYVTKKIF